LTSSPRLTLSGAALTLQGVRATLELLDPDVVAPYRTLTRGIWTVDTFIDGGAAAGYMLQDSPLLEFSTDGLLRVFTGCNTGQGTYTRSGQTLTLGSVPYTEEGCNPPLSALASARVIRVMSEGELSLEIEARRLTLMRGTIGLSATNE